MIVVFIAAASFALARPSLAFLVRYGPGGGMLLVSAMSSGFMAARAIAAPLSGALGDWRPRLRKMFLEYLLAPIALLLLSMYLFPLPILIVILMTFWGFIAGFYWPTMQYVVSNTGRLVGKTASYLGLYFSTASLGFALGYQLYGSLGLDERSLVGLASLIYFASFGVALAVFSKLPVEAYTATTSLTRNPSRPRMSLREIAKAFSIFTVWVLAASFAVGFARGTTTEFMYVYLYEVHGIPRPWLGGILATSSLVSALGSWASGVLADRLGLRRVLVGVLVAEALSLMVLGCRASSALIAVSIIIVFFAGRASLPLTRNIVIAGNPAYAGTILGLSNTVSNIGSTISPIIGGLIYEVLSGYTRIGSLIIVNKGLIYVVASALLLSLGLAGLGLRRAKVTPG